jgi:hypothetical protein
MPSPRRIGRCTARCPDWPMCMAILSRGIVPPAKGLAWACGIARCWGAHIESFTLILEEHVCPSLAIACTHRRTLPTQRNHAERSCRAAGAICERHDQKMGVGRGDGWRCGGNWSSLVEAAQALKMTVAAARPAKPRATAVSAAAVHGSPAPGRRRHSSTDVAAPSRQHG